MLCAFDIGISMSAPYQDVCQNDRCISPSADDWGFLRGFRAGATCYGRSYIWVGWATLELALHVHRTPCSSPWYFPCRILSMLGGPASPSELCRGRAHASLRSILTTYYLGHRSFWHSIIHINRCPERQRSPTRKLASLRSL